MFEGGGLFVVGDAGDDDVDVGVVLELAGLGVEDGGEAHGAAEFCLQDVLEGTGALF